eukprot:TRINITY_DN2268_c0_g2_i2.p1 TRINITY_DN2268_c0_g2~~TRINITY_DN2268_c0_g2_i2.p1  ORF type:complete len:258 (-),score=15.97 TRINITY_DN2268_c0_g2_i2:9-782(-)
MCWSSEASAIFSLIGVAITLLCFFTRNKRGHGIEDCMIPGLYAIMEGFQFLQHLYGDIDTCNDVNQNWTFMGHFLWWIQIVVWNYWGLLVSKRLKQEKSTLLFKCTFLMSVIVFSLSCISLIVGHMKGVAGDWPSTEEYLPNVGFPACSVSNPETARFGFANHYMWVLPYDSLSGHRPNMGVWLLVTIIPQLFRTGNHWLGPGWYTAGSILFGWAFTATIWGFSGALVTSWCFVSVPAGSVLLLGSFIFSTKKTKTK